MIRVVDFDRFLYGSVETVIHSLPLGYKKNVINDIGDHSFYREHLTLRNKLMDVL